MVKVGFIVEGDTEERMLSHQNFMAFLQKINLDYVKDAETSRIIVVNAEGGGNLMPDKLEKLVETLADKGATHTVVLTDLENEKTIDAAKKRVDPAGKYLVVIAVQKIEAWILADTEAISQYFKLKYYCEFPEAITDPFDFIKKERMRLTQRGVGSKIPLITGILKVGFSLESAATHPNCPSAKYFLDKLTALSSPKGN
jgi:hypothetical protein